MVVEDVLNPEKLERQRDQENIVGRITPLNDMKAAPQKDPPGIPELPKQCRAILPEIPERTIALLAHRMPVYVDSVDRLVSPLTPLGPGTQHGDIITGLAK